MGPSPFVRFMIGVGKGCLVCFEKEVLSCESIKLPFALAGVGTEQRLAGCFQGSVF